MNENKLRQLTHVLNKKGEEICIKYMGYMQTVTITDAELINGEVRVTFTTAEGGREQLSLKELKKITKGDELWN